MTVRRIVCGLAAIAALTFSADVRAGDPWVLTSNGLGPIRIGMSPAKVAAVLGRPVRLEDDEISDDVKGCAEIDMPGMNGVGMLFLDQRLHRISVYGARNIQTPRGIGLGATEDQVRAKYIPLDIKPRDYQDLPAKDMTFHASPSRGIRFKTTAAGKVDEMVAGGDSINYMESCA